MLISEKQKKANKANAQKSTGPKTNEGKKKSSKNGIKHGLYCNDVVIDCPALKEDPDEYQALLDSLYHQFEPLGRFEEELVIRMANCLWRARRACRAESARIRRQLKDYDPDKENIYGNPDLIEMFSIPDDAASVHIQRYEMRLDRQLSRTYSLLMCLQQRRKTGMIENLKKGKPFSMKSEPLFIDPQPVMPDFEVNPHDKNRDSNNPTGKEAPKTPNP